MATVITDLKESFRRGNIYIQLIYINVGVFIFTTLTGVILQLFDRLQHLPLFPSDDGVLFHAGSIGIRTRYRGGYRLSGT